MEEKELEKEIYKILGIKEGSLKSNSGNDWERAKNQILEEEKRKLFEKNDFNTKQNYLTMEKSNELYNIALKSSSVFEQDNKIQIAKRDDLKENEIDELIKYGDKDVLINITKFQKLNENQITNSIEKHTYLTIKNIVENQNINKEQLSTMIKIMSNSRIYKDLMEKVNKKYNIQLDNENNGEIKQITEKKQSPIFQKHNELKEVESESETFINTDSNEISFEKLDELNEKNKSLLKECTLTKEDVTLPNLNSKYKTVDTSKDNDVNEKKEVKSSNHKQR
jgi:hypothetical protein